jgi:hypothetical protein
MTNLAFGDFDHGNPVNFAAELECELASANLFLFVENQTLPGHFIADLRPSLPPKNFKSSALPLHNCLSVGSESSWDGHGNS